MQGWGYARLFLKGCISSPLCACGIKWNPALNFFLSCPRFAALRDTLLIFAAQRRYLAPLDKGSKDSMAFIMVLLILTFRLLVCLFVSCFVALFLFSFLFFPFFLQNQTNKKLTKTCRNGLLLSQTLVVLVPSPDQFVWDLIFLKGEFEQFHINFWLNQCEYVFKARIEVASRIPLLPWLLCRSPVHTRFSLNSAGLVIQSIRIKVHNS